ncbi:MAG: histidine phosphatase family protein [Anaerolineae bacterium]|nr:MAG: histidine phosphatase family protein [Anaerolineae bacterium]
MISLLLIRHGQTDWNIAGRWQGHTDIPLNETGLAQGRLLARRLSTWPIKAVYSSDLSRAARTADLISEPLNLQPIYLEALRERNGGLFQGMTTGEIHEKYPEDLALLRETGMAPHVGESNLDVAQRLLKAFERIISDHEGEMVAIVSHGGALASIVAYYLGFPLGERARLSLRANTGLSIVEIDGRGPIVTLLNDVSHLSGSGLSLGEGFSFGTEKLGWGSSE